MSSWFPALDAHPVLRVALVVTAVIFFIAELGILIFLVRRKNGSPSRDRTEIAWTLIPGIVLVVIVLLAR